MPSFRCNLCNHATRNKRVEQTSLNGPKEYVVVPRCCSEQSCPNSNEEELTGGPWFRRVDA